MQPDIAITVIPSLASSFAFCFALHEDIKKGTMWQCWLLVMWSAIRPAYTFLYCKCVNELWHQVMWSPSLCMCMWMWSIHFGWHRLWVSLKSGLWTLDWTHGLDCGLRLSCTLLFLSSWRSCAPVHLQLIVIHHRLFTNSFLRSWAVHPGT